MKLQKVLSRTVAKKEYSKFQIVIPPDLINTLDWKEGEELEGRIENGELILCKKKN